MNWMKWIMGGLSITLLVFFASCSEDGPTENQAPSIGNVPDKITFMNRPINNIEVQVTDPDTQIDQVSLVATSDDQDLIPDANIEIEGSGNNRLMTITPADESIGETIIELTADDGQAQSTQTFKVTVNQPPSTWSKQNSGITNTLNALFFLGDTIGWAVGSGETILKTIDGGDNWTNIDAGNLMQELKDVAFIGEFYGWIVGHHSENQDVTGKILFSDNGGVSWIEQQAYPDPLNSIFASQTTRVWAVGDNGLVTVSANSGQSWTHDYVSGNENLYTVFFLDEELGWAAGENASIYVTQDGGQNWIQLRGNGAVNFNSIFFIDEFTGWVCGSSNTLLKTETGGLSWSDFQPGTGFPEDDWQGIYFIDENKGWLIGRTGRVFRSVDGGASWDFDGTTEVVKNLNAIQMMDEFTGYIAGEEGVIMKYDQ